MCLGDVIWLFLLTVCITLLLPGTIDEEDAATAEIKALGELIGEVERHFTNVDVTGDGISQAFFGKSATRRKT